MTITDANDERPTCPVLADIQVNKDAVVGYRVLQLLVSDADIGVNAEIIYNGVRDGSSNEGSLFRVDSATGEIFTIEYVNVSSYTLRHILTITLVLTNTLLSKPNTTIYCIPLQ